MNHLNVPPYYLYKNTQGAHIGEHIEEDPTFYVYHLQSQCLTQCRKNI